MSFKSCSNGFLLLNDTDRYKLLISGYIRIIQIDHNKLNIPRDIQHVIYINYVLRTVKLIFCDENGNFDETKYIERGVLNDHSLKQLLTTIRLELFEDNENSQQILPDIHIWMKFNVIKFMFPINKRGLRLSEEDLSSIDPQKYMEIPYDYLKTQLSQLSDLTFVIEIKNNNGTWPRRKNEDEWKNIECGDILDIQDEQNKWYETWIRYVYPKGTVWEGYIITHPISWNVKWDERLLIIALEHDYRICKRNTHTKGPHILMKLASSKQKSINVRFKNDNERIELEHLKSYYSKHSTIYNTKFDSLSTLLLKQFKINGPFKIMSPSGFFIETEEHIRTIAPYYIGHFVITSLI